MLAIVLLAVVSCRQSLAVYCWLLMTVANAVGHCLAILSLCCVPCGSDCFDYDCYTVVAVVVVANNAALHWLG